MKCGVSVAVVCSRCDTELPAGAAFCFSCGQAVTARKSSSASPESYTPKHLAERIINSKAALEGERKQVTVLFADLKGSMELLADRDPEEARKVLDPVLELMMEAVHRFEGTVNQVMGDGIMALFGAPIAHEDHAVRACYAALRIQEAIAQYAEGVFRCHGVPVQIRVGLNSGEVVVRAIGSDLHMDYTAVGQTTHLAARMEQMAAPGTILLAPATLQLVEGYVEVTARGPVAIKGLPKPVEVYALAGASALRSRLHAAAARGFTRFVGRDPEIEHIRRALGLAHDGHGQLVAIVGDPGVGKSRLVYEFTHSDRTQDWLILEAGSVSYGKATSYLPVIDLLKCYFKVHERETHREIREKVIGKLLALDRNLSPILPALLALLDVPVEDAHWHALDAPQRRQRTLEAVKHVLLRESQDQPILVVFEDLHWIDAETQALLDGLVENLPTAKFLLLVNYRPEYQHGWGAKTYYSQLRLDALPPESASELLQALLGADSALEPLKRLLVRRGNPFFIEESIRTLVETRALTGQRGAYRLTRPIEALDVPTSVQAILAARIDRLPADDKLLLQTASVIGKDIPLVLLNAVAESPEDAVQRRLAHLQAAEFLYEARLFPDPEYTFKHALTHEVTYATLLLDRRKTLHAQIVGAINRSYEERRTEHVERLAHHAVRGEMWEQAVTYLRQAGVKSLARSANSEATAYFEQALSALARQPETSLTLSLAVDLRFDLYKSMIPLGSFRRLLQYLREADAIVKKLDDQERQGWTWQYISHLLLLCDDSRAAVRIGLDALALAESAGDVALQMTANFWLGCGYYSLGAHRRAVEVLGQCIVLQGENVRQQFGLASFPAITVRGYQSMFLSELGEFTNARLVGDEAIRIAETIDHPYSVAIGCWQVGTCYAAQGGFSTAASLLERGLRATGSVTSGAAWTNLASALGYVFALSGRAAEGLALAQEALNRAEANGHTWLHGCRLNHLAEAYLSAARADEAKACAQRSLEFVRERHERGLEAWAMRLLGESTLQLDAAEVGPAERYYHEAIGLADQLGMRPLVAHCHVGLGKLYRRTGKHEDSLGHLKTATMMYREMDMRFWLEQAEAVLRE
jgi:class 3 adenylate cyclase/tetratricopeptide (TPR) repeat protein